MWLQLVINLKYVKGKEGHIAKECQSVPMNDEI